MHVLFMLAMHTNTHEMHQLYKRGLRLQPQNAHLLHGMAQLHAQQLGDVARALELLQQILDIHPHHARARYSMGQLLQGEGRFEEAQACYEAGMEENASGTQHSMAHHGV